MAFNRVVANKGADGGDGVIVEEAREYVKEHQAEIKESIRTGSYKPQAERRIEIPEPNGSSGGVRGTKFDSDVTLNFLPDCRAKGQTPFGWILRISMSHKYHAHCNSHQGLR